MLHPLPLLHSCSACLHRGCSLSWKCEVSSTEVISLRRKQGRLSHVKRMRTHTGTRNQHDRKKTNNTTETNRKYTKYTSVFITVCKHFVLHFKNATIKLLAHLCTKQINCNACYKALFVKIQTLIPEKKRQKHQHHYISLKDSFKNHHKLLRHRTETLSYRI